MFNFGTAEHVFDLAQVFTSIHKHTKPGDLMFHGLLFTGYVDHGFYNFQPTFFWDLALANNYKILAYLYVELRPLKIVQLDSRERILQMAADKQVGFNSLVYIALQKTDSNLSFRKPMQGQYFNQSLSDTVSKAWQELR